MNILYLHGLNGSLNNEKRAILEKYGEVYSPSIDYEKDPNSIEGLINLFKEKDINVVIGSSMGGFAGYYISNAYQRPALLFNPALAVRSVEQLVPILDHEKSILKHFVLGTHDDIVDPKKTLDYLIKTVELHPEYTIHLRNDLAHRIPVDVFKEEVDIFFNKLCF
ncbi:hypothetical protein LRR18_00835 [Mangrovimonas sp. AS39]|uniref:YqiA/YcfP family alpha/beta fold hydrolase n=1 Tax=Mangrovimonas futianensis TaxID=2895523 RepID=UPI001E376F8E|nr:YqiA/YcfP family alpha/beta fold hydrolase [Mangrovimonas futianensis]MCF1190112.1 hypothetical protein [Mangrovimonas futianensis]MCF1194137.1 hypothetical protein [Mangrovimonas futianensis]